MIVKRYTQPCVQVNPFEREVREVPLFEDVEGNWVRYGDYGVLRAELCSAVDILRDIARMSRKVGSETARNWLQQHGYPLEEGGYVAGKGFVSGASA